MLKRQKNIVTVKRRIKIKRNEANNVSSTSFGQLNKMSAKWTARLSVYIQYA